MQVKIFTGRSYDVVESDINAWLTANREYNVTQIHTAVDSKNNLVVTVTYEEVSGWDNLVKKYTTPTKDNVGEELENSKNVNWLSEVICDTTDNAVNWINENLLRSKKEKTND